jgi:hypothetical protein
MGQAQPNTQSWKEIDVEEMMGRLSKQKAKHQNLS